MKKVIVGIEFNSRSGNGDKRWDRGLTMEWISYRMSIFMKFTLQCLIGQTTQKFTSLIQYADTTEDLIRNELDKYPPLPGNIRFVPRSKYQDEVKNEIQGYKFLYLVRLDVDDMYINTYIQQLHEVNPDSATKALICKKGYLYDFKHHRLAAVKRKSPPFYTFIYKVKDYLSGYRHRIPGKGGHGRVFKLPHEIMKGRNYMVVVHSMNTVNTFRLKKKRDYIIQSEKIPNILKKFIKDFNP